MGLDGRHHAGDDAGTVAERWSATQQAPDFHLDLDPLAVRQFPQQPPIKASVQSQPFRNRQHNLPVRDQGANLFGHVQCGR